MVPASFSSEMSLCNRDASASVNRDVRRSADVVIDFRKNRLLKFVPFDCGVQALTPFVESGHVLVSDYVKTSGMLPPSIAGVGIGEEWTNFNGVSPQAKIRLSDPEGFLVSNEILSTLFSLIPKSS
jgi:hypothetical protein